MYRSIVGLTSWAALSAFFARAEPVAGGGVGDAPAAPPAEVRDYTLFQQELNPFGTWLEHNEFGPVWQPQVASRDRGWRPYSGDGHWVRAVSGFQWHSDSPWGRWVFHYGRWALAPDLGWVWVPGPVWAPAWVHWRSSDSYMGWAPLPPDAQFEPAVGFSYRGRRAPSFCDFGLPADRYVFVPRGRFLDPDVGLCVITGARALSVYRRTSALRDGYRMRGGHIVCIGPPLAPPVLSTWTAPVVSPSFYAPVLSAPAVVEPPAYYTPACVAPPPIVLVPPVIRHPPVRFVPAFPCGPHHAHGPDHGSDGHYARSSHGHESPCGRVPATDPPAGERRAPAHRAPGPAACAPAAPRPAPRAAAPSGSSVRCAPPVAVQAPDVRPPSAPSVPTASFSTHAGRRSSRIEEIFGLNPPPR